MPATLPPARFATSGVGAVRDGMREMAPLLLAVAPFGLVFGVTLADSGVPLLALWSTSWLVYGGSAQLAALGLVAGNASALVVVASVALINLRLSLYAMSLAPHWRGTTRGFRALAAYLIIDPSFVVGMKSYDGQRPTRLAHLHYLGGAILLWAGWQLVTALGVTIGSVVPASLQLDFIAPLYIVSLVVPAARERPVGIAVTISAVTAVATMALPLHIGPAAGMVAGLAAGLCLTRKTR
jgi:predicted branched-subunit amino acid permease